MKTLRKNIFMCLLNIRNITKKDFEVWIHLRGIHCVKNVRFRSFSGPYCPTFGLNTERYSVSLCIQCKCGKIRTRKTTSTDTFQAVIVSKITLSYNNYSLLWNKYGYYPCRTFVTPNRLPVAPILCHISVHLHNVISDCSGGIVDWKHDRLFSTKQWLIDFAWIMSKLKCILNYILKIACWIIFNPFYSFHSWC